MRFKRASVLVLVLLAVVLGSLWATYRWSERYFLSEISDRGRDSRNLYAENIRGWLERFRALPRIYAHNPNVSALLRARSCYAFHTPARRFWEELETSIEKSSENHEESILERLISSIHGCSVVACLRRDDEIWAHGRGPKPQFKGG